MGIAAVVRHLSAHLICAYSENRRIWNGAFASGIIEMGIMNVLLERVPPCTHVTFLV
jgi:hypothetical protein